MVAAVARIVIDNIDAIAKALAFTGSQVAAKSLGANDSSMEEVKRHNAALEQLQKLRQNITKKDQMLLINSMPD